MALYLLKPVLWNTTNYQRPSGWMANGDCYPAQHGFGHEEWNNSPRLEFTENGQRYRTFHTERLKNAPTEENRGQTFVFMIASHEGIQQLVGLAGNAHYIGGLPHSELDPYRAERLRIAKLLQLHALGAQAWEVPRVKAVHGHSKAEFNSVWKSDASWICNWICPAEFFWWPHEPITLQASDITGKSQLPKMFSSYMPMELPMAEAIMGMTPAAQRGAEWSRLVEAMRIAPGETLPSAEDQGGPVKATTKLSLGHARVGQGKYRQDLILRWGGACAVTGVAHDRVLRASHVKPWKDASDRERLDANNGLLLCANLDALFDAGLISFADDGTMVISSELDADERGRLGLPGNLRLRPNTELSAYLAHHRENVFRTGARL
ncbi:MAG: HNH endonuclease [Hylemonella sp.]